MTYIVVAYDISSNVRRFEAAEKLKGLGFVRIQKSLYIGRGGVALAKEAYRALLRVIDKTTDSVFIVVVPREAIEKAFAYGLQNVLGDEKSKVL